MKIEFKRIGHLQAFFIDGQKFGKVEMLDNGKYKAYTKFQEATGNTKTEAVEKLINKLS